MRVQPHNKGMIIEKHMPATLSEEGRVQLNSRPYLKSDGDFTVMKSLL